MHSALTLCVVIWEEVLDGPGKLLRLPSCTRQATTIHPRPTQSLLLLADRSQRSDIYELNLVGPVSFAQVLDRISIIIAQTALTFAWRHIKEVLQRQKQS